MIVRKHLHGALPLFFLCFALFSGTTLASSEAPAATPTAASSSPSESLEKRIKDFNRDLAELVILQDKAVGEDKLAMQLQMFQKTKSCER